MFSKNYNKRKIILTEFIIVANVTTSATEGLNLLGNLQPHVKQLDNEKLQEGIVKAAGVV